MEDANNMILCKICCVHIPLGVYGNLVMDPKNNCKRIEVNRSSTVPLLSIIMWIELGWFDRLFFGKILQFLLQFFTLFFKPEPGWDLKGIRNIEKELIFFLSCWIHFCHWLIKLHQKRQWQFPKRNARCETTLGYNFCYHMCPVRSGCNNKLEFDSLWLLHCVLIVNKAAYYI